MRINKIELRNYRSFEHYAISFGQKATIFIGKNGMGKTNLMSGLKQSLSFIFSRKRSEQQQSFIASSDQTVESFAATDAQYRGNDYQYPVSIRAEATLSEGTAIDWEFWKSDAVAGLKEALYRGANEAFWRVHLDGKEDMPIIAFYSDTYPHLKTSIGKNMQHMLDSGNELPRNAAYYKWNEEKNCTEVWVQYFTMQWKNYKYSNDAKKKEYIDAITKAMVQFSQPASDNSSNNELVLNTLEVEARGKNDVLIMAFANGERIPFHQMPQGYRRIFSMVFDLANRSYILNANCCPTGIVMIDELELHLHPSIAQEILRRLQRTYPLLQLIVSTHSPLVITNFEQDEQNILYKLFKTENSYSYTRMDNLFGVDYNSGLKYSMDTPERDSHLGELKEAYDYWKEENNEEMMRRLKEKIRLAAGEQSEVYKSLY